jgi:hypothetical protein
MILNSLKKQRQTEQGNVLFLILIAVALFAYLGFTMTKSSQSIDNNDQERAYLDASDVIKYAAQVSSAIERIRLANHCKLKQMSFDHPKRAEYSLTGEFYANSNAPMGRSCHVFENATVNVLYVIPPPSSQAVGGTEYNIHSNLGVYSVGTDSGNAGVDLTMATYVTEDVCFQINKIMGNRNPSGVPPVADTTAITVPGTAAETFPYFASFADEGIGLGTSLGKDAGNATELAGRPTGCFYASSNSKYTFYSVLIPR